MTYAEARLWLKDLGPLGVTLGTERVAEVLQRLGQPQQRYPALHIAGTNGKGSTAAFCASLLVRAAREAGRQGLAPMRIGLYTSPHLLRLTERIQLGDEAGLREVSEEDFAGAMGRVKAAAAAGPAQPLSFFEVLTVAAFLLFAEQGVQVAVIETGLGGRLDATRLCVPVATVVTSIGLDHTELLGPTLSHIAYEKAGIFQSGVPAYVSCTDPQAMEVLVREAAHVGAPLRRYDAGGQGEVPPLCPELADSLPLAGAHQRSNAALALAATQHVPPPLSDYLRQEAVRREGILSTRWPGRLERLRRDERGRELWVDAAHNPEGAQVLGAWLRAPAPGRQRPWLTVVLGVVTGKLAQSMLDPVGLAQAVVLTRPPSPRGRDPQDLMSLVPGVPAPQVVEGVAEALQRAYSLTPPGGMILVYGSIFLVAETRRLVLGERADPSPLQDPMSPLPAEQKTA